MFSTTRITAIRKSKGLSQEVLAEQSGVSLRTIQRVEQGETEPRGYTLQALAAALDVPLEAFRLEPEPAAPAPPIPPAAAPPTLRSDPDFLQLLNLSALSFLVLPLLNILVPWALWRSRRHTTAHVAEVGRRVLGFQILWQVGSFFAFMLVLVAQMLLAGSHRAIFPALYIGMVVLTYGFNVLMTGYYGMQLRKGNLNIYPTRL
ncbi:helix-turn-helix domain-containing protein [Hymenobacter endophyticus]|uniref:Helix-turn-helix domain-containing protein n=1 Tax=Hymenobacter endophyticus TaxID=3076335 RepID=A0ABU3TF39_9BACT|nr:helix-turn-helix domain-containing protein [Hymenobacter endophyticus]MDU0369979.1 helix-turn-helix domain-containing protein [Hymenobacter endophyticus]